MLMQDILNILFSTFNTCLDHGRYALDKLVETVDVENDRI